jgi:hypothetical protein
MTTADPHVAAEKCAGCSRDIDRCCFCDRPGCSVAICYRCLMQELKQTRPQPHAHGG